MKFAIKKFVLVLSLCLALVGMSAILGACSNVHGTPLDMGTTFPAGSSNNPYSIAVSQGNCTSWVMTLDQAQGTPWCASTVPRTLHTGDMVKLSYGGAFQLVSILSIDVARHQITLGSL